MVKRKPAAKPSAKPKRTAPAKAPVVEPPPRGERRAQNKLDKRERIRDAAWALFVEQGFAATTTKAIAARAGVGSGTIFLYADDKRDLLFLIFRDKIRAVVEAQRATLNRQAPFLEQLLHLFGGIFRMYGDAPALAGEFVGSLPGSRGRNAQEVNAETFAFLAHLATLVRDGQARGELQKGIDPLMAARNIFSLYFGALLSWIMGLAPTVEAALDPVLKTSLELQLRGLAARSG